MVLAAYAATLFSGIPGGDSGELVAEACHLGVAHPPGYPLFTLLGHAVVRLLSGDVRALGQGNSSSSSSASFSVASPAVVMNGMSAVFGAGAAALIAMAGVEWPLSGDRRDWAPVAGVAAGAVYALTPLTWLYSIGSEVFALNNFCCALALYLTVRWARVQREVRAAMRVVCWVVYGCYGVECGLQAGCSYKCSGLSLPQECVRARSFMR